MHYLRIDKKSFGAGSSKTWILTNLQGQRLLDQHDENLRGIGLNQKHQLRELKNGRRTEYSLDKHQSQNEN